MNENKKIKLAIFDLDGVLSKGNIFEKNATNPERILYGEKETLEIFNKFMDKKGIFKVAVTGRSLIITKPIVKYCMDDISACEHGCIIYDPKLDSKFHLIDSEDKFQALIQSKNYLENFIEKSNKYDLLISEKFPKLNIQRLKDNLHILTYEFSPKQSEEIFEGEQVSKNIYNFLYENLFDDNIKDALSKNHLIPIFSNAALDIKPNISKADGLKYIISKLGIDTKNILIGGDSFHSDLEMMKVIKDGFWFCPGNSDDRLKQEVIKRGERGYVSQEKYFKGAMEALNHFLGD